MFQLMGRIGVAQCVYPSASLHAAESLGVTINLLGRGGGQVLTNQYFTRKQPEYGAAKAPIRSQYIE